MKSYSFKRLALSVCLSLGLAAAWGVIIGPCQAQTLTSVEDLKDADSSHWAYDALKTLVEQYGVLQGDAQQLFNGDHAPTRWEMATALRRLSQQMGRSLAKVGAEKAASADLQTLARLQEEFRQELNACSSRTNALSTRLGEMEARDTEEDARLRWIEKTAIHGDFTFGGLSNMGGGGVSGRKIGGIKDSLEVIGRLRLTVDVPVVSDAGESSHLGAGVLSTRVIAGYGPYANNQTNQVARGADYPFNFYSRVAADTSPRSDGLGVGGANPLLGDGINVRSNVYLESAFYKQHFKPGLPLLSDWTMGIAPASDPKRQTSGDLYLGLVRWWDLFDLSPYRGNELTQFENMAFINIPGIAVNIVQPMAAYQWHQGLGKRTSLDLTAALGSNVVDDLMAGLNLTYEARLNYTTAFLGERFTKPGSAYVGAYHLWKAGGTDPLRSVLETVPNRSGGAYRGYPGDTASHSLYMGWNQEWLRGIGTNVGYLLNNSSPQTVANTTLQPGPGAVLASARQSLSAVITAPLSAFGASDARGRDAVGVGYAFSDLHEGGLQGSRFSDGWEHVMEAFYRYQINDAVSLIPNWQLILNRLGLRSNNPVTVLGVRVDCTF
ncbi:MAG: carbohydrate porin [Vampirovibrionales bacterium]|nr:carbohydrate porin [Vampirovibrionales bacterium]